MQTRTKFIGIINLTPDSFSDGGVNDSHALRNIESMIEHGADGIDFGAESTRPNADILTAEEEKARLMKVLPEAIKIAKSAKVITSIDTRNVETANMAVDLGIDIINDVSAAKNIEMLKLVEKNKHLKYIFMHSLKIPADKTVFIDESLDIVDFIYNWAVDTVSRVEQYINKDRLILDAGIGFGKTPAQDAKLIKDARRFRDIGLPVLYGHSRKSFLKQFTDSIAAERDVETCLISDYLMQSNIDYLRVHNIGKHKSYLKLKEYLFG